MIMLFLHGPPACGKLTIAREIGVQLDWPVFHNHLVVDAVGALFPFGSPNFVRLREEFWMQAFDAAAMDGRSFIFTFAPEKTVRPNFAMRVNETVGARGGSVRFVALTASPEVIATRVEDESRAAHGKLRSRDQLRELITAGAFDVPPLPAEFALDSGAVSPIQAAARIISALDLLPGR
ncbi:hypothetical protein U91I_00298 [alpha proteobacterium U9-1i]|nr:hypothetical protein U91I_00298 [alpha proteobacterium U9-1i]